MICLEIFKNQTVSVDGKKFDFCVFEDCTMFTDGSEGAIFDNCDFVNCKFIGDWPSEFLEAISKNNATFEGEF